MTRDNLLGRIFAAFRSRPRRFVYRSAVTGRFVSKTFAKEHPDTTTAEEVL